MRDAVPEVPFGVETSARPGGFPSERSGASTICVRWGSVNDPIRQPPACLDECVTGEEQPQQVVRATREIAASPERIFELIADPAQQPRWDGNDNLKESAPGQRVRAVGDVFTMRLTRGGVRENYVVDFVEGRRIAWRPAVEGKSPPGHLWAWELEPLDPSRTLVTHTYD